MGNEPSDLVFLRDRDWSAIDAEPLLVTAFFPMARIEDGKVRALHRAMPYASITFECSALPQEATGFISHRMDFEHLWRAFEERGVGEDEEVIVFWTKQHLKRPYRFFSKGMPRLWVMVCPKGAFGLMADPERARTAGWRATFPIAQWKPEAME